MLKEREGGAGCYSGGRKVAGRKLECLKSPALAALERRTCNREGVYQRYLQRPPVVTPGCGEAERRRPQRGFRCKCSSSLSLGSGACAGCWRRGGTREMGRELRALEKQGWELNLQLDRGLADLQGPPLCYPASYLQWVSCCFHPRTLGGLSSFFQLQTFRHLAMPLLVKLEICKGLQGRQS